MRERIFEYVRATYKSEPEYLWMRFPRYAVFRRPDNKKWYVLVMDVPKDRLGLRGGERVDLLNVKTDDPLSAELLAQREGFFKGYHISRGNWVSVLLDGTVPFDMICEMIDLSFRAAAPKRRKA